MMVLDASTALAAILPDEQSTYARAAVAAANGEGVIVPALWKYEVQNGLAMALRRGRLTDDQISAALFALRALEAKLEAPRGIGQELRLAQAHGLTAYDAAYLAVAINFQAMLATSDARLVKAAAHAGVALFASL